MTPQGQPEALAELQREIRELKQLFRRYIGPVMEERVTPEPPLSNSNKAARAALKRYRDREQASQTTPHGRDTGNGKGH